MIDLLEIVEEADFEFQKQRPQLRQQGPFAIYLPAFIADLTDNRPELHFPLLAKLAQTDLQLSLLAGETVVANDYFTTFPELAASPAVINDLLRTEASLRCGGDALRLWQFIQRLPEEHRAIFIADGIVPRYKLLKKLGGGGMAEVWLAADSELNREVAVKVPHRQDDHSLQTFVREAQLTARFQHPAIVPVYGLARAPDGNLCYAMQRLELKQLKHSIEQYHGQVAAQRATSGGDDVPTQSADPLASTILSGEKASTPPTPPVAAPSSATDPAPSETTIPGNPLDLMRMVGQLTIASRAVAYAHQEKNVLHLDLKPENILVGDFGETMVVDWGLAKSQEEALAGAGGATLSYMSPEVARHWLGKSTEPPTTRTDIYGLGATLYHLLTGRPPFAFGADEFSRSLPDGASQKNHCIARVASELPQPIRKINPQADRVLTAICQKAMAPDPAERYATAEKFAAELEKWQSGEETSVYPFPATERLLRWARKHWRFLARLAILLLALLVVLWLGWRWLKHREVTLLIDNLATVNSDGILPLIDQIHERPLSAPGLLRNRLRAGQLRDAAQARADWRYRLALLPYDDQQVTPLLADLQQVETPEEFALLSRVLRRGAPRELTPAMRERLDNIAQRLTADQTDSAARLRIAATFAAFDADHAWTPSEARLFAADLVRADPAWLSVCDRWIRRAPTCQKLIAEPLEQLSDDPNQTAAAVNAAAILANWRADDPPALIQLLKQATPRQLPVVVDVVRLFRGHVAEELQHQQTTTLANLTSVIPGKTAAEHAALDEQAATAANLVLARWSADQSAFDPQLLHHAPDPRLRTEIIHRLPHSRISAAQLARWIGQVQTSASARSALLLALARYPASDLTDDLRAKLLKELDASAELADPEFIAALEHLHRQWSISAPVWTEPAKSDGLSWQLTKGHQAAPNHRLITIPRSIAEVPTSLGADSREGHADEDETPRLVAIPRSFAIGVTEVTRAQLREFVLDALRKRDAKSIDNRSAEEKELSVKQQLRFILDQKVERFELKEDFPAFEVNLAMAAAYCNWLSEREGFDACYPESVINRAFNPGLDAGFPTLDGDLLSRDGYRLPTEEEWELACRAGTTTPRHYGYREAYLGDYATYRFNSRLGPRRVAHGPPNAWGLFDMHGNVSEWCHTTDAAAMRSDSSVIDQGPVNSPEEETEFTNLTHTRSQAHCRCRSDTRTWYVRGCAHFNVPDVVRSAYRLQQSAMETHVDIGFRIARTLPGDSKSAEQD